METEGKLLLQAMCEAAFSRRSSMPPGYCLGRQTVLRSCAERRESSALKKPGDRLPVF